MYLFAISLVKYLFQTLTIKVFFSSLCPCGFLTLISEVFLDHALSLSLKGSLSV